MIKFVLIQIQKIKILVLKTRVQELIFRGAGTGPVASLSTSQTQIGASEDVSRISTLGDVN